MKELLKELGQKLGKERVGRDALSRVATAADAGCYKKIPEVVLKPGDEKQVSEALAILQRYGVPVTFRAAGTSLSG